MHYKNWCSYVRIYVLPHIKQRYRKKNHRVYRHERWITEWMPHGPCLRVVQRVVHVVLVVCACVWFWLHNNSWPTTRVDSSKRKQQRKRLVYSCEPIMDYNCLWYCWKTQNESILFSAGYESIALLEYVWDNHTGNYEHFF